MIISDTILLSREYTLLSNLLKILNETYFQTTTVNLIMHFLSMYLLSLMSITILYNSTLYSTTIFLLIIYILSIFKLLSNIFIILSPKITLIFNILWNTSKITQILSTTYYEKIEILSHILLLSMLILNLL